MASAPPFRVKAVYEYKSAHGDDLNFDVGEVITVTEEEDDDWYVGEYTSSAGDKKTGLFPRNFVEKLEPEAPPRPTRSRPKKDEAEDPAAPANITAAPANAPAAPDQEASPEAETVAAPVTTAAAVKPNPAPAPAPAPNPAPAPAPAPAPVAAPAPAPSKAAAISPPPVAEKAAPPVSQKPTTSSFKDRIAAFNKPSAPPVAPKPSGPGAPGSSNFIKKPFVAPPPSRHAYVPPPPRQDVVPKVYRREEDPEIAEQQKQDQANAEAAGLLSGDDQAAEGDDQLPKTTSLKDRIALLQKQQQEQALRRAEVTATKDKKRAPQPDAAADEDDDEAEGQEDDVAAASRAPADTLPDPPRPPPAVRRPSKEPRTTESAAVLSDGNEADESGAGNTTEDAGEDDETEVESEERPRIPVAGGLARTTSTTAGGEAESAQTPGDKAAAASRDEDETEEAAENDQDQEDEEDVDPEVRRKMELRERMAKMSGGMGMPGMFGGMGMPMPGGAPKPRPPKPLERKNTQDSEDSMRSPPPSQRVPIPGMMAPVMNPRSEEPPTVSKEPEDEEEEEQGLGLSRRAPDQVPDVEDVEPASAPPVPKERGVSPIPSGRPIPPQPQARSVPPPPPPARPSDPVKEELEAEEELLEQGKELPPAPRAVPPLPTAPPATPSRPEPRSTPSHSSKRSSVTIPNMGQVDASDRRTSRLPPPIPGTAASSASTDARPPPPPPPAGAPPPRRVVPVPGDAHEGGDGESEYEGDYDTDIGSAVPHKDALKAHHKNDSIDTATLSGDTMSPVRSPQIPAGAIPLPGGAARAPPPPPPSAPRTRASVDAPRAVPPPPPPARAPVSDEEDEYDPYRYGAGGGSAPTHVDEDVQRETEAESYAGSPPTLPRQAPPPPLPQSPPPAVHAVPPPLPPPHQTLPPPADPTERGEAMRPSLDVPRQSMSAARRSSDQPRASLEQAPLARDIDLEPATQWWTQPNTAPPSLQSRSDVLLEFEESTASKRGGRTTVSRDVYVLYTDLGSSTISARFDPREPAEAALEQHHTLPPARPSQDQLEAFHEQFSKAIVASLQAATNNTIGDGSPLALVRHALAAVPTALPVIGSRTCGALVYANLGNASVTQVDEIRAGDIVTFRNAKFSGKHGAMHAKYSMDVGEPEHVAVVAEWDGTKKKVRGWEQGRGSKKAKVESFKLGDLRSGEVKVWRVVPRAFVGWDGESS